MFGITFENEVYKQWTSDYIFEDFKEAKNYLLEQGFIESKRLFERKDYNWSKYVKAYIAPKKIYKK
jgi:hypothetical protein